MNMKGKCWAEIPLQMVPERQTEREKMNSMNSRRNPKSGQCAHTSGTSLLIDILERLGRLWFLLFLFNFGAVSRDGLDQLLLLLAGVLHNDDATCVELVTDTR